MCCVFISRECINDDQVLTFLAAFAASQKKLALGHHLYIFVELESLIKLIIKGHNGFNNPLT